MNFLRDLSGRPLRTLRLKALKAGHPQATQSFRKDRTRYTTGGDHENS